MLDVLEQGSIAFVYRPRVQKVLARGIEDVQAFYVLLVPEGRPVARRLRIGRKRLPDGQRRERFWAYVERTGPVPADVIDDLAAAEYWTKTRGLRHQPGPRLAGEGTYAVARHGSHVHLAYALRRDSRTSEVRDELRIASEASYIVAAFAESLPGAARVVDDRRFVPLEPEHLDVPGTELVLIGRGERPSGEDEPRLETSGEDATLAALRDQVRRASGRPPSAPLLEGLWH